MTPEPDDLAQRMDVEKQIAHLASLVVAHLETNGTVSARRFVVRDDEGCRRAELCVTSPADGGKKHPVLAIFDQDEKMRATLGLSAEGPTLQFTHPNTKGWASIGFDDNGPGPCLTCGDANGQKRLDLGVFSSGTPALHIFDANGRARLNLQADSSHSGEPLLIMADAEGGMRLKLSVDSDDRVGAYMTILGPDGQPSIVVRSGKHEATVYLRDPKNSDGNTCVQIVVNGEEVSLMSVKDGRVLWSSAQT